MKLKFRKTIVSYLHNCNWLPFENSLEVLYKNMPMLEPDFKLPILSLIGPVVFARYFNSIIRLIITLTLGGFQFLGISLFFGPLPFISYIQPFCLIGLH